MKTTIWAALGGVFLASTSFALYSGQTSDREQRLPESESVVVEVVGGDESLSGATHGGQSNFHLPVTTWHKGQSDYHFVNTVNHSVGSYLHQDPSLLHHKPTIWDIAESPAIGEE